MIFFQIYAVYITVRDISSSFQHNVPSRNAAPRILTRSDTGGLAWSGSGITVPGSLYSLSVSDLFSLIRGKYATSSPVMCTLSTNMSAPRCVRVTCASRWTATPYENSLEQWGDVVAGRNAVRKILKKIRRIWLLVWITSCTKLLICEIKEKLIEFSFETVQECTVL